MKSRPYNGINLIAIFIFFVLGLIGFIVLMNFINSPRYIQSEPTDKLFPIADLCLGISATGNELIGCFKLNGVELILKGE